MRVSVRIDGSASSTGSNWRKAVIGFAELQAASASLPSMVGACAARAAIAMAGALVAVPAWVGADVLTCAVRRAAGENRSSTPETRSRRVDASFLAFMGRSLGRGRLVRRCLLLREW